MRGGTVADRNRELAVIHVAKKQLGLADADYRALLSERFGVITSAALKDQERRDLIAEFEHRGFRNPRYVRARVNDSNMLARIRVVLGKAGRPLAYGDALAKRICGVDRLDWCTDEQQRKVLAALEADRRRREVRADELPAELAEIVLAFSGLEKRVRAMYAGGLARRGATPASALAWVLDTLAGEAQGVIDISADAPTLVYRSDSQYARDKRGEERRELALANAWALKALIGRLRRVVE